MSDGESWDMGVCVCWGGACGSQEQACSSRKWASHDQAATSLPKTIIAIFVVSGRISYLFAELTY